MFVTDQHPVSNNRERSLKRRSLYKTHVVISFIKRLNIILLLLSMAMLIGTVSLKSKIPGKTFVIFLSSSIGQILLFSVIFGCLCYKLSKSCSLIVCLIKDDLKSFSNIRSFLEDIHVKLCDFKYVEDLQSRTDVISSCLENMKMLLRSFQETSSIMSDISPIISNAVSICDANSVKLGTVIQALTACLDENMGLFESFSSFHDVASRINVVMLNDAVLSFESLYTKVGKVAKKEKEYLKAMLYALNSVIYKMMRCKWVSRKHVSGDLLSDSDAKNEKLRNLFYDLVKIRDLLQESDLTVQKESFFTVLCNIIRNIDFSFSILFASNPVLSEIFSNNNAKRPGIDISTLKLSNVKDLLSGIKSKLKDSDVLQSITTQANDVFGDTVGNVLKRKNGGNALSGALKFICQVSDSIFQVNEESVKTTKLRNNYELCCIVLQLMILQGIMLKLVPIISMDVISNTCTAYPRTDIVNTVGFIVGR